MDVDGVINSINNLIKVATETNRSYSGYSYPFDPDCLRNLKELVLATNSSLVISSSWRKDKEGMEKLLEALKKYGLDELVVGCTPDLGLSRGAEIKKYLEDAKFTDNSRFVILDDDRDMEDLQEHLICTDIHFGLTKEDVQKAIGKLSKSKDIEEIER